MGKSNLKVLRERRGWTLDEAAHEFGMSRGGYIKLERGERRLSLDRVAKAAAIYQVSETAVTGEASFTKIVGWVEPDATIRLVNEESEQRSVASPPESSPEVRALEVRGGALPGVAENQWLIFYDDAEKHVADDRIGSLCVVCVDGGATIRIGRIFHGGRNGTYDLAVSGSETVRDLRVEWCARVTWIKPQ